MTVSDGLTNKLFQLEGAFGRVFEKAVSWAEVDFQQEFIASKWRWEGKTRRKNGETVGSPRDIIDMGDLMQSQTREQQDENTIDIVWTGRAGEEPYASFIHDGWTSKSNKRLPGRPWTDSTIEELPGIVNKVLSDEVRG